MKASPSASSAPATSPVRDDRKATRRPYDWRATSSIAPRASSIPGSHEMAHLTRHRANLDGAGAGGRAAGRPVERRVERGQLEEDESAELLLGVGVRSILHLSLSVLDAHGRARRIRLKRRSRHVDPGLDERLVVRPPGADQRRLRIRSGVEVLAGLINQHHELHGYSLSAPEMASLSSTGITTTANGVPASSVTIGRVLLKSLPPSIAFL